MSIRDYRPDDFEAIKKIHERQGFDYTVPELNDPLFLVKKVLIDNGRVVAACALRLTAETFLFVQGSPVEKGRAMLELQPEILREAYEKGLSDIILVVPPPISEAFAPALLHMGWEATRNWPKWQRNLL
jgi:hypothetical protein